MHAMLYAVGTEFAIMVALVWLPTAREHADTTPQLSKYPTLKHPFPCARKIYRQTFFRGLRASGDEKKLPTKIEILKMPHILHRRNRSSTRSILLLSAVPLVITPQIIPETLFSCWFFRKKILKIVRRFPKPILPTLL